MCKCAVRWRSGGVEGCCLVGDGVGEGHGRSDGGET
jgi:hypothetical protein